MEIIKKWKQDGKDFAWVTINNKEAFLFNLSGKESDSQIFKKAEIYVDAKERLKLVQEQIKKIKNNV